jgi:hypothetical protein
MENFLVGQKHIVTCRCMLPQYKKYNQRHRFVVFSIIENDVIKEKFVECNNCGIVHKVYDVCKSQIINRDEFPGLIKKEDIKSQLPQNLIDILEKNDCDLATWENVKFIIENKFWGNFVVLSSENIDGNNIGKYIQFFGENLFKIESFINNEVINGK